MKKFSFHFYSLYEKRGSNYLFLGNVTITYKHIAIPLSFVDEYYVMYNECVYTCFHHEKYNDSASQHSPLPK